MPLMLNFERDVLAYQKRADVSIRKYGQELQPEYVALMRAVVDSVLGKIDLSLPGASLRSDSPVLESVNRIMAPWYEVVADDTAQEERATFYDVRDILMRSTEELFDVEYTRVPDDQIPIALSPDTASKLSLNSDTLVKEEIGITFILGEGGIDAEFERYINEMFDAKIDARNAIRTFAEKDIARIKTRFLEQVRRGTGFRSTRDAILRDLLIDQQGLATQKVMAMNVDRITRTVHQRAALATTFSYARRNEYVNGLVRHIGPRPCMACRALDGKIYKTWQEFRDHPNGMCTVVPRVLSIEELRKRRGVAVTPADRKSWKKNTGYTKNKRYEYLGASPAEQSKMVGNNTLYKFWQDEDFPIERFASYQDKYGFFQKASFAELALKIEVLGGISFPKSGFASAKTKEKYLKVMDAKDRANPKITVTSRVKNRIKITDDLLESRAASVRDDVQRLRSGYSQPIEDLPYFVYNDIARLLRIPFRKARNGTYYAVQRNA